MKSSFRKVILNWKTLSNVLKSNNILCASSQFVSQNSTLHLQSNLTPTFSFNSLHCSCLRSNTLLSSNSLLKSSFPVSARCFSAPTGSTNEPSQQNEQKPSLYQRFKAMYRDYWYVLLPVHVVTSVAWFGGFYYLATSGVDIVALLEKLNVSDTLINPLRNGKTGYLAISYALYKIATPVRYTITLGGTTVSINYLKKWGYIKPVPSKEKLKEIYQDKKEIFKERGQTLKDNMMQSLKPTESKSKKNSR